MPRRGTREGKGPDPWPLGSTGMGPPGPSSPTLPLRLPQLPPLRHGNRQVGRRELLSDSLSEAGGPGWAVRFLRPSMKGSRGKPGTLELPAHHTPRPAATAQVAWEQPSVLKGHN